MHIFFQNRGSQLGMILPSEVHLAVSGDIFSCHHSVCVGGFYWHLVRKARDTTKHPIMHRTGPTAKNYVSVQNVKSVMMEKLCPASLRPTQSLANKGVLGNVYCTEKKIGVFREQGRVQSR